VRVAQRLRERAIVVVPAPGTEPTSPEAAEGFVLGLAVASSVQHAGDRAAAVVGIARTLQHELRRAVVAWHVDAEHGGFLTVATAGVSVRARAELAGRCEVRPVGSRRRLLHEIAARTAAALGVSCVTTIDAGVVVFAVAGDVPVLEGSDALLADVIATVPVAGANGDGFPDREAGRLGLERLSGREHEVLTLLAEGLGTLEVAARLAISPMTVKTHVQNILAKLGVRSRLEAALLLLHDGDRPAEA
jgi:DNA-binding CsgD family transcriptional regulator